MPKPSSPSPVQAPTPVTAPVPHRQTTFVFVLVFLFILLAAAAIIIGLVLFFFRPASDAQTYERGYELGFREGFSRARTLARPLLQPDVAVVPRTSLLGVVTGIENGMVSFRATDVIADARVDGVDMDRTVTVTGKTELVAIRPLTEEEFLAANQAFESTIGDPAFADATPPSPETEIAAELMDFHVGDQVRVWGPEGEDLSYIDGFTASKILLIGR